MAAEAPFAGADGGCGPRSSRPHPPRRPRSAGQPRLSPPGKVRRPGPPRRALPRQSQPAGLRDEPLPIVEMMECANLPFIPRVGDVGVEVRADVDVSGDFPPRRTGAP